MDSLVGQADAVASELFKLVGWTGHGLLPKFHSTNNAEYFREFPVLATQHQKLAVD